MILIPNQVNLLNIAGESISRKKPQPISTGNPKVAIGAMVYRKTYSKEKISRIDNENKCLYVMFKEGEKAFTLKTAFVQGFSK